MKSQANSVDAQEIEHFAKDAPRWWDETGPFAPLHRLNPARMGYIKSQICVHFGLDEMALSPLDGLSILDIGCGGGLVCEPLARMGAKVTGIDADIVAVETAIEHAKISNLDIEYKNESAESYLLSCPRRRASGKKEKPDPRLRGGDNGFYDIVLALEIIEHVASPAEFVNTCAKLLKPGGLIIFSTLNRTPKSFALGIVAAEYILRWVPRGTHDWKKFIKPSELERAVRAAKLTPINLSGLMFNPFKNDFEISKTDIDVNYFLSAGKAK